MVCDLEIWRHIATEAHWKSCEASRALCAVKWLQKKVQEEKNVDLMAHQSLKEQPHHSHSTSAWDMRTTKMNWRETHLMWTSSGKCLSSPWRPSLWPSNSDCYKPWLTNCVAGQRSLWLTPGRIWKVIKRSSKVMIWLRIKFDIYNSLTKLEICWKVRKRNELACLPPLDVKAARGLQCPWPTTWASDLRNQNHGLADGSAGMRSESEAIFWRWFFGWSNTQKFHLKMKELWKMKKTSLIWVALFSILLKLRGLVWPRQNTGIQLTSGKCLWSSAARLYFWTPESS